MATDPEIDLRRRKVYDLKVKGFSTDAIAKVFEISAKTVSRDIAAVIAQKTDDLDTTESETIIAEILLGHENLLKMNRLILQELEEGQDHARRSMCIATEMRIQNERVKMLQMYGKLPQSGTPVVTIGTTDEYREKMHNMTPTEVEAELARIEAEILKRAESLPKALRQLEMKDADIVSVEDGE